MAPLELKSQNWYKEQERSVIKYICISLQTDPGLLYYKLGQSLLLNEKAQLLQYVSITIAKWLRY